MRENRDTLRRYFGTDLFPGSLNLDVDWTGSPSLHRELDQGHPPATFRIPRAELRAMRPYLGDAQVWQCELFLEGKRVSEPCWLLRRIGSQVPANVLEVVSVIPLVTSYHLGDGRNIELRLVA